MSEALAFRAKGLGKSFPGVRALENFDFDLKRGEVHCLLGENGAGKSTFINILSGAFSNYDGEIYVGGVPVQLKSPTDAKSLKIATIHQELHLVPAMTVEENIHLGSEPRTAYFLVDRPKARSSALRILDQLGVTFDPDTLVRDLSNAEAQMVEIAKALVLNADILILDEPTAAISGKETDELFRIIRDLKTRGTAFIYISHRLQEIAEIADRVTVMRDGELVETIPASQATADRVVTLMVGRPISSHQPRTVNRSDQVALSIRGMSSRNIHNVSFDLHHGEILGFAGLIGAGRTELMKLIFGAETPQSGQILLNGKPIQINSPRAAVRHGIGYLSEDRKLEGLVLGQPVYWNMSLASLDKLSRWGVVDRGEEQRIAKSSTKKLAIAVPDVGKRTGQLSGGNQQKVVIAKWLHTSCKVLIFDEPTRGIDVNARAEIHKLIRELADAGTSVIVVSSDLPELIQVSDRILVMSEGSLTGETSTGRKIRQEDILDKMLGGANG